MSLYKLGALRNLNCNKLIMRSMASNSRCLDLSGIYPPIPTPFNPITGDVALEKLKGNFDKWNAAPLAGYVLFGSNGEFPLLSLNEKMDLIRTVRTLIPSGRRLIVGAGAESTRETIRQCEQFAETGADVALVITPAYYKGAMTNDALENHFKLVADASPIPIVLYNMTANTGVELSLESVLKLARHDNIVGLKDSNGNIAQMYVLVEETKSTNFQILAGSAGFLLPALHAGCVGGVLALTNILPDETCQLLELFKSGQFEKARLLQSQLFGPNLMITRQNGVPGLKHMMDKFGFYGGSVRLPLRSVDPLVGRKIEDEFSKNFSSRFSTV